MFTVFIFKRQISMYTLHFSWIHNHFLIIWMVWMLFVVSLTKGIGFLQIMSLSDGLTQHTHANLSDVGNGLCLTVFCHFPKQSTNISHVRRAVQRGEHKQALDFSLTLFFFIQYSHNYLNHFSCTVNPATWSSHSHALFMYSH